MELNQKHVINGLSLELGDESLEARLTFLLSQLPPSVPQVSFRFTSEVLVSKDRYGGVTVQAISGGRSRREKESETLPHAPGSEVSCTMVAAWGRGIKQEVETAGPPSRCMLDFEHGDHV